MATADIDHRFNFHAATTEEKRNEHTSIREAARLLAHAIDDRCPDGREKAIALTKIEETMFWGNAAIARNQ